MHHTIQSVRAMIESGELVINMHWGQGDDATHIEWVSDDMQSSLDLGTIDISCSVEGQMELNWLELMQQGHDGSGKIQMTIL